MNLHLNGVTKEDQLTMTPRLDEAIRSAEGWVTGYQQFSDVSICITFEIDAVHVPRLREELLRAGLRLCNDSERQIDEFAAGSFPGLEVEGSLQVTFLHESEHFPHPHHHHHHKTHSNVSI